MKKYLVLSILMVSVVVGDEGMWMPQQMPELEKELKELGFTLDPNTFSELTSFPMGAIVSLGGCTASFVSEIGLTVTNHHCAFGSIQYNSTPENNLLENGFYAKTLADELPAGPGTRIYVTVEVKNVTDLVQKSIPEKAKGRQIYEAIEAVTKQLIAEGEEEGPYRCSVSSFYGGKDYFFIKKLEIKDVRLVYAPPSGVGKFGGDIDNWMWPRHTGDFSFYRAYVGPDGQPAEFNENNVPFEPKHYLRVAKKGLKEGDFVMVAGYPGRTNRHVLASEVSFQFAESYPQRIKYFQDILDIIEKETKGNPDAALKYAATSSYINNSLKNNQGMLEGFEKTGFLKEKMAQEEAMMEWIEKDSGRKAIFAEPIAELQSLLKKQHSQNKVDFLMAMANRMGLQGTAGTLYRLSVEKEKPDAEREMGFQERDFPRIEMGLKRKERTMDPKVDQALFKYSLLEYAKLPAESRIPDFDKWFGIGQVEDISTHLDQVLDDMYAKTSLKDTTTRLHWAKSSKEEFEKSDDPMLKLAIAMYPSSLAREEKKKEMEGAEIPLRTAFMKALVNYRASLGELVYPDANSSLRITYGVVKGYQSKDAVNYLPFTTLRGILEKDTGVDPFNSPQRVLDGIRNAQSSTRYWDEELKSVPVNYLSTVDTTGGNSGSPTMNGEGELIGLLFDGNYESMTSDWLFNTELTRSIHVDIRYVLWLMDEIDHADRLLQEMGFGKGQ